MPYLKFAMLNKFRFLDAITLRLYLNTIALSFRAESLFIFCTIHRVPKKPLTLVSPQRLNHDEVPFSRPHPALVVPRPVFTNH